MTSKLVPPIQIVLDWLIAQWHARKPVATPMLLALKLALLKSSKVTLKLTLLLHA